MIDHEAARIARALSEGRGLSDALGIPPSTVLAARDLARWADALGETGLALATWEGCAALDDACASWLGVAGAALAAGELRRAWDAAARVSVRADATALERADAHLVLARVCLALGRRDEALAHLALVHPTPLTRALQRHTDGDGPA